MSWSTLNYSFSFLTRRTNNFTWINIFLVDLSQCRTLFSIFSIFFFFLIFHSSIVPSVFPKHSEKRASALLPPASPTLFRSPHFSQSSQHQSKLNPGVYFKFQHPLHFPTTAGAHCKRKLTFYFFPPSQMQSRIVKFLIEILFTPLTMILRFVLKYLVKWLWSANNWLTKSIGRDICYVHQFQVADK